MFFGQFIDELSSRLSLDKADQDRRVIYGLKINNAYKEIANNSFADWEHLKREGEILTIPNYTTGTCTITNSSRTVTFSGATLTSAMVGRYFQPQGSFNWYKIVNIVSSSQFTLFTPIIESSASGQTFTIWKRYYYFPSEVRKILNFSSWIQDGVVKDTTQERSRDYNPNLSNTGEPLEFIMFGSNPFESQYTTGSAVTMSKDNNTLTATGSSWLDNVEPGDFIQAGNQNLRVKRVETDTQIRLLNYASSDVLVDSYKITKQMNLGFQLWFNPKQAYILPYTYMKRAYDMVNETYDRPELPDEFDKAILDLAEADRLSDLADSKWTAKQSLASARINDLKVTRFVVRPTRNQMRPFIENNRSRYL